MNNFYEIVKTKDNQELLKMVYEFDEWSPEMLSAVKAELEERNILPTDLQIQKQKLIEIEEAQLEQGKEASTLGQVIGWLTIFGLLGIYIGYNYAYAKIRSKYTDKEYYQYSEATRKKGKLMFQVAIVVSSISIIYRILLASGDTF